ncbi:hypothetical protein [Micromonospora aurantiaca (nom. illeg.)]
MRARRMLAATLGIVLGAGLISVGAAPAQAYEHRTTSKSGWAYTDSQQPRKSFVNTDGDAPVGAWTDATGTKHKSRSYFTFDVSRFRGTVIHKADLVVAERSATDCSITQPVELWRTDPITATTSWASSPRRRELLGTVQAGGEATCPGYLAWDIMPALQKLADQGKQTLTVEIRLPHGSEGKLSHGRKLRPFPVINSEANHAPRSSRSGSTSRPGPAGPRRIRSRWGRATTA